MKRCTLCPRNCNVDREAGERGVCGVMILFEKDAGE